MINVKMDGLEVKIKRDMECLMDGLKSNMEAMMNAKMEALKEGFIKLLQERLPIGDKVIHENHDEEKRYMNYDLRDSNVGFKTLWY